jgi:hypothetical protein
MKLWTYSSHHDRGQSTVEFLVICALVVAIFATPVDGHSSLLEMFLEAVRTGYRKFLAALAVPL